MEFKGTKGKWERVGNIVYIDENSKTIYPYYECGGFGIEKEANALLISESLELLENAQMHIDALDLSNIEFYEKYGFNVSELIPRTRELIKRATEL
jgi:hypothetical protein